MDFRQFSAKTVDEAITRACIELGLSSDRLEIQVISEGSSGFLGIGSKPAVIQVREKEAPVEVNTSADKESVSVTTEEKEAGKESSADVSAAEKAAIFAEKPAEAGEGAAEESHEDSSVNHQEAAAEDEKDAFSDRHSSVGGRAHEPSRREGRTPEKRNAGKSSNSGAREKAVSSRPEHEEKPIADHNDEEIAAMKASAEKFLRDIFAAMEMTVQVTMEYSHEERSLNIDLEGNDMGILIGKRGQTLDSLQYLVSLVVNREQKNYVRVKLDTEDYRRRRTETLENLAKNIAYKVKRTHRPVSLEAMNPYERRIIHSALQNNRYVETHSEGNEPYRYVVITPKKRSDRDEQDY